MDTDNVVGPIIVDDFDVKKLFSDQDDELTLLSGMVRDRYLTYLEKQLLENFNNCYLSKKDCRYESDECCNRSVKHTAKLLEDKAIEACMIAQYYQRAMVKIIAIVRRSTQEHRLITQLEKTILNLAAIEQQTSTKETQTETGPLTLDNTETKNNVVQHFNQCEKKEPPEVHDNDEESHEMTLDEKIEIFQKHLKNGHSTKIIGRSQFNRKEYKSKSNHHQKHNNKKTHKLHERRDNHQQHHHHHRPYKDRRLPEEDTGSENSIITPTESRKAPPQPQPPDSIPDHDVREKSISDVVADMDNSNDSVAMELARLFSEEKTELDEIFGIDPNEEPDDPQICKILKEIEEANVQNEPQKQHDIHAKNLIDDLDDHAKLPPNVKETSKSVAAKMPSVSKTTCVDLSKSMWPCELFMQKRKLSESLARLIEEDLRWHDLMKWKFCELFGEDSDDEFTPCSPSIELDEIVMGSCVKRISPWVVKHLMGPMRDGLIGNRFIFKKVAKHIARSIITENQYPDESVIKGCVENYFCLYQAVMTLDDLQNVPSISLL